MSYSIILVYKIHPLHVIRSLILCQVKDPAVAELDAAEIDEIHEVSFKPGC